MLVLFFGKQSQKDTAANVGILALLETIPETQHWPLPIKTGCGSILAGLWRIVLMPIDTSKTVMQVEGYQAIQELWFQNVPHDGIRVLYRGSIAQAAATAVGHFPWFITYNMLDETIPIIPNDPLLSLCRSAFLGLSASCVSDCTSNSLRVIKTTKQTASFSSMNTTEVESRNDIDIKHPSSNVSSPTATSSSFTPINDTTTTINNNDMMTTATIPTPQEAIITKGGKELSYPEVVALIIEKDGLMGLFGRGLQTRILTNAIQGAVFSVLWRYFQQINNSS
jgi:Mitochondrial carrier protein